jgi:hypothetical protein
MLPKLLLLKQKRQRQVKMEKYVIGLKHHAATVLKSLIIELVEKNIQSIVVPCRK